MKNERGDSEPKVRQVFLAALDIADAGERKAFLVQACKDDPALLQQVNELLFRHKDDSFLEKPAIQEDSTATVVTPAGQSQPKPLELPVNLRYFGDYELMEEVARGGMGVVFKARQKSLNRIVAVKMIRGGSLASESDVKRFRAEAEAAANLQHPNIVAIHEVGEHEGQHYFSMDLVEGPTLAEVVKNEPLPAGKAAHYVKAIAEAVQYAHQRGILHRDLKPSNVLLDAQDRVRVTDFGLAKVMHRDSDLTRSGDVMGSPAYMAPEQAQAKHKLIGPPSDVYSLGALLYHLITGRPPFSGESMVETLHQMLEEEPESPSKLNPKIPADLETICLKCLSKQPEQRYATASALAEELDRFLNYEPILAKAANPWRRLWHWTQKNPWVLAGGFALLVVLFACTAYGFYERTRYLEWHLSTEARVEPDAKDSPSILFFKVFPLLILLLYIGRKEFLRTYVRHRGSLRPSDSRLLFHAGMGLIAILACVESFFVQVKMWAWELSVRAMLPLEVGAMVCEAWLAGFGAFLIWESLGVHESSRFQSRVDKVLESEASGGQWWLARRLFWITVSVVVFGAVMAFSVKYLLVSYINLIGQIISWALFLGIAWFVGGSIFRHRKSLKEWAKKSVWRRYSKVGALVIGVVLALLSLERFRGHWHLSRTLADMKARGQATDIRELILTPSEQAISFTNQLSQILTNFGSQSLLAGGGQLVDRVDGFTIPAGFAARGSQAEKPLWVSSVLKTNSWSDFAARLETNRAHVLKLHDLLADAPEAWPVDVEASLRGPTSYVSYRQAAQWLNDWTVLALHKGDLADAERHLIAQGALMRMNAKDASLVGTMIRVAVGGLGTSAMWDALQADGWTEAQLKHLQQNWQSPPFLPGVVRAMECERLYMLAHYRWFSEVSYNDWMQQQRLLLTGFGVRVSDDALALPRNLLFHPLWKLAWAEQEMALYLNRSDYLVTRHREALSGKGFAHLGTELEKDTLPRQGPLSLGRYYLGLPLTDRMYSLDSNQTPVSTTMGPLIRSWSGADFPIPNYIRAFTTAARNQVMREMAVTAIALKRHQLRHGKLPAKLEELVPEFLPELPTDWWDGKPLRYRLNEDGTYLLYSVGSDGKDDGGDPTYLDPKSPYAGGRDQVWPRMVPWAEVAPESAN